MATKTPDQCTEHLWQPWCDACGALSHSSHERCDVNTAKLNADRLRGWMWHNLHLMRCKHCHATRPTVEKDPIHAIEYISVGFAEK